MHFLNAVAKVLLFLEMASVLDVFFHEKCIFPLAIGFLTQKSPQNGSIHAIAIVLVAVVTKGLGTSICMTDEYGRMADTIKGSGLDSGIMNHILKDDLVANGKGTRKAPRTHEIARKA